MRLRHPDYLIIFITCIFLGIAVVSQVYAGKEYNKAIQPENNATTALEVASLTKSNADLRREVQDLTHDLDTYKNSSEMQKTANDKYQSDLGRFSIITGTSSATGQGVIIRINGKLSSAQIVDLVNAIKNIGSEVISINGTRLVLQTDLRQFKGLPSYEIKVLGNSKLFKSAMERKGGIIDQLSSKDISINVEESDTMTIEGGTPFLLQYAKIVKE